jgi:hypothetical protein
MTKVAGTKSVMSHLALCTRELLTAVANSADIFTHELNHFVAR